MKVKWKAHCDSLEGLMPCLKYYSIVKAELGLAIRKLIHCTTKQPNYFTQIKQIYLFIVVIMYLPSTICIGLSTTLIWKRGTIMLYKPTSYFNWNTYTKEKQNINHISVEISLSEVSYVMHQQTNYRRQML